MNITTSLYVLLAALVLLYRKCRGDQPAYQVSLYVRLHPRGPLTPACNGAIVQSHLILTSAACVHYQFTPERPPVQIHAPMITVVAGSTDAFDDALLFKVSSIIVFDKFNSSTLENDLAILRLSTSLPLNSRNDIKWIILGDDDANHNHCVANFHDGNSMDNIPDYTQTEEVHVFESAECIPSAIYSNTHEEDICSNYDLPTDFDCKNFNSMPSINEDRGTGLVCNNRLVGILSTVLLARQGNETDCLELSPKALYINLIPHLDWIYEIIAEEELRNIMQGDFIDSSPYQRETGAILQAGIPVTDSKPTISFDQLSSTITITSTPGSVLSSSVSSSTQRLAGNRRRPLMLGLPTVIFTTIIFL